MKLPEYQPTEVQKEHPGMLLFSYFGALFREHDYKTGPIQPKRDVINLDSMQLQHRYTGVSARDVVDRRVLLKLYGEQIAILRAMPVGSVSSKAISSRLAPSPVVTGKPPLSELTYHEASERLAQNHRLTLLLKYVPDLMGIRGVETFSLHIRTREEFGVRQALGRKPELQVDHKYHLPDERNLYDLPQSTGGDRSEPRYPFLGPPELEPTNAFWEREPITDKYQARELLQKLGEMMIND
jgi:hypothetical protein